MTIIALVVGILEQWFSTSEAWRLSSDEFVWILSNFDHSNLEYQIRTSTLVEFVHIRPNSIEFGLKLVEFDKIWPFLDQLTINTISSMSLFLAIDSIFWSKKNTFDTKRVIWMAMEVGFVKIRIFLTILRLNSTVEFRDQIRPRIRISNSGEFRIFSSRIRNSSELNGGPPKGIENISAAHLTHFFTFLVCFRPLIELKLTYLVVSWCFCSWSADFYYILWHLSR